MARSWEYSRARWITMQFVMWVLLACTVGVAALVGGVRRSALELKLDSPQSMRSVSVRLPRGWTITRGDSELSPVLVEAEGGDALDRRILTVTRSLIPARSSPLQVIEQGRRERDGTLLKREPLTIAGQPGWIASFVYQPQVMGRGMTIGEAPIGHVLACTVLPSGRSLEIEMIGLGAPDEIDVSTVRRVADSIAVENEPAVAGRDIRLERGITATAPEGFGVVDSRGPNRTEVALRSTSESNGWRSIVVVPILFLPGDSINTLKTMVALADTGFAGGDVRQLDDGTYQFEPIERVAGYGSPARGFARVDASGRGVLALLCGGNDDRWIAGAWKELSDSLKFEPGFDVPGLIDTATREIAHLRSDVIPAKMTSLGDESWWTYNLAPGDGALGWLRVTPAGNGWGEKTETRLRFATRVIQQIEFSWQGAMDLSQYKATSVCQVSPDVDEAASLRFRRYLSSTLQLKQGLLELHSRPFEGEPVESRLKPAANYLPGGMLCDLLGSLSDKPMILQTDLVIWHEDAQLFSPLTVLVEPLKPGDDGFRRVGLEVVGTGERQVWTVDRNGIVREVSYDDGLQRIRCEQADIDQAFSRDAVLRP